MLKKRIMSGLLLGGMCIAVANYLPSPACWLLLVGIAALAQYEFYGMLDKAGLPVFRVVGMLSGAAVISATFWTIGPEAEQLAAGYRWENLVILLTVMAVFMRQFPQKNNHKPIITIAVTLLGVWYVAFLLNYLTRLAFGWRDDGMMHAVGPTGRMMVIYLVAVVKMSDVGAFFTGRKLGKHKLFPRLSPKKTIEGLAGGVVSSILVSLGFFWLTDGALGKVQFAFHDALILGMILPVVGVLGDLFESLLKRAAGIKDSGTIIPGMGGVLDVLDSLLFGAPVLYAYVSLFLSVG
ncbi:MAG: phosphatidate cytidylyltransferase [Verrucomicrobia bacterium]|jgi:phosphatidate cytidylyltransferase|nr:phosphatidate cytidylyltransferase [Verrucomicrobiota bacterium]